MSVVAILAPVLVQVALTFVLGLWTASLRVRALRRGELAMADIALGQPAWPAPVMQVGNAFQNQFQLPVLFYVLVALAILTRKADTLFVVLSWMFVATRFVHAFIHTGGNDVPTRFAAFLAGVLLLLIMWVVFAVRLLMAEVPL